MVQWWRPPMIKSRLINFIPVFATVGFFKHSKNFSLVCSQELKPKPRLEARKLRLWDFFLPGWFNFSTGDGSIELYVWIRCLVSPMSSKCSLDGILVKPQKSNLPRKITSPPTTCEKNWLCQKMLVSFRILTKWESRFAGLVIKNVKASFVFVLLETTSCLKIVKSLFFVVFW